MPPKETRLPPSAPRVLLLAILAWGGYVAFRTYIQTLIPPSDPSAFLEQDGLISLGRLACALFCYWLARLRYSREALHGLPGRPGLALLAGLVLVGGEAIMHIGRLAGAWDVHTALWRAVEIAVAVVVAANEEIGFRGALFLSAKEWGGAWLALLISSLGFALMHLGYQNPVELLFIAPVGLAFGVARLRGASLFQLILIHAAIDSVDALWAATTPMLGDSLRVVAACLALILAIGLGLWGSPKTEAAHG